MKTGIDDEECLYNDKKYTLTNVMSFVSLIFGMFCVFQFYDFHFFNLYMGYDLFYICCCIAGLITGIVTIIRTKKEKIKIPAKSIAIIGIVSSIILLIEIPLIPYIIADTREKNNKIHCLNNQRQISQLIIMYVQDHGDKY